MIPFKVGGTDRIKTGTAFDDVLSLYVFDRELRLLVLDALERVEVSVRSSLTDHMSLTAGGPFWYEDVSNFRNEKRHKGFLEKVDYMCEAGLRRSPERTRGPLVHQSALEHYLLTYGTPERPPSWIVVEELTIGQLEKLIGNLSQREDRTAIARALSGIKENDAAKAEQVQGVPRLPNHSRTLTIERNAKRAAEGLDPREVPDDRPWAESTLLGILRNPRYAGYSVYTDVKDRRSTIQANQQKKAELESAKGEPVLMVKGKRRAWRDYIGRDENGQLVKGKWTPLADEDLWQRVQERLDDPSRATNRVGTHRRHLGSGLYLCGLCDEPIRGALRGYRCKHEHINRTGAPIDDLVRKAVAARLREPDALRDVPATDSPRLAGLQAEIHEHRAKIARAERDYDGLLEATDLKRNRDR